MCAACAGNRERLIMEGGEKMFDVGYSEAWPDSLKELYWTYYRAWQQVRNLNAYVERVDPNEFYGALTELEQAQKSLYSVASTFRVARQKWDAENGPLTVSKATQS